MQKILSILGMFLLYGLYYGGSWYINRHVDINNQGVDLYDKGLYTGALDKYNKALEIKPNSSLYNSNKAIVLFDLGDYNRALVFYDNAIKYHKGNNIDLAENYSHRGATYFYLYKNEEFKRDINKSLELNPDDLWALYYDSLYKNYKDSYNFTGALDSINKYISLDTTNSEAYFQKAEIFYYAGKNDLAIEEYKKVIKLNPQDGGAYFHLGHSYYGLEKWELALENYKKVYVMNRGEYLDSFYVGYSLYKLGNEQEAYKYFKESFTVEGGQDDEILKLYLLDLINKFENKNNVVDFLKKHYGVGIKELNRLLKYIEIYEKSGYTELQEEIELFKKNNKVSTN